MFKTNFRERVLRAYAAIMKFLAPTYCVKSLTLNYIQKKRSSRKNENAYLFLPGVEKELKAIEKLQFGMEEIRQRQWSPETEIELLKKGNFALVSRIKTEEALDIVIKKGFIRVIIEALKVYTPSKSYLLDVILPLGREKLLVMIKDVSSAFDSLESWEVLKVDKGMAYKGEELWAVARALVSAKPEKWAPKFINEVMKIVPENLNDEARKTLKLCVEKAVEEKLNISKSVAYLMGFHPLLYAFVRVSLAKLENTLLDPYVNEIFPQLVGKLSTNFKSLYGENSPSEWVKSPDKLSEEQEAACWLKLALNPESVNLVVNTLSTIKARISIEAFGEVEREILPISDIHAVGRLMVFYKENKEMMDTLRNKLLQIIGSTNNLLLDSYLSRSFSRNSWILQDYYPFEGWTERQAESAVRIMAIDRRLPGDLSSLSKQLRTIAVEELEIQSQIAVIREGTDEEKVTLMQCKLHARSEQFLFGYSIWVLVNYASQYIRNFHMEESSFRYLVGINQDSSRSFIDKNVYQLIQLHARTWGLSEQNYRDLMQSKHYRKLAAILKPYYMVEMNDTNDGAV